MPKLTLVKPQKCIKILLSLGFVERDAEGSHVFLFHEDGRSTVIPRMLRMRLWQRGHNVYRKKKKPLFYVTRAGVFSCS